MNKDKKLDIKTFSEDLERDFKSGKINKIIDDIVFEKCDYKFIKSLKGQDYVDKLFKDGRRLTGRLVGDEWVEVK